ncbi:non-ribosomal peptide synthetase [Roseibium sp. RKSG952]|uniref:non-ribosomal peptide synthetase n=1 Tax=Roseibium sp. RKSG952 TaxID=2529384 RepID=UPI0012BD5FDC|nr:non-ribosomal peptide synthetase [Roseibium sp. RKSG952]MTH95611.1 amino acid adenylation domain-containing protein [Roseibium sp. RKSG952]
MPLSLGELLIRRARDTPDRVIYRFHSFPDARPARCAGLTCGGLYRRSEGIGARLQEALEPGDRALILCPPGLDYIAAFFACQLTGVIAVPAYPPRNAKHMARLEAILADAGATTVVCLSAQKKQLEEWAHASKELSFLAVDEITSERPGDWQPVAVNPDAIAFLQYTSGTTGAPKGVMVSHGAVLENLAQIHLILGYDKNVPAAETDGTVNWLPPYHDMGLVATILYPLYAGIPAHHLSPASFIQNPLRWLRVLSGEKATITTAPNFAWQLCCDAVADHEVDTLDFSALKHAFNGAEPVRFDTLMAFSKKFGPAGFKSRSFRPIYGMAETVVLTSCSALSGNDQAPHWQQHNYPRHVLAGQRSEKREQDFQTSQSQSVLSCGTVMEGHEIAVADPETFLRLEDGAVGEIWISGPCVASGYWNKPKLSQEVFCARLKGDASGRMWLRTGDLGTLIDGGLYVLGRIKEMIIVRGQNHYAVDLEIIANDSDPLLGHDRTIAFGVEGDGGEKLVLVHELSRSALRRYNADAVAQTMRLAILEQHDVSVETVVFIRPASLPRTTSGKLQRSRARELFLSGNLSEVAKVEFRSGLNENVIEPAGEQAAFSYHESFRFDESVNGYPGIRQAIVRVLSDFCSISAEKLTPSTPLQSFGLDSLQFARVLNRLQAATGRTVDLQTVYGLETLDDFAKSFALDKNMPLHAEPIPLADRSKPVPASYQQERLWFLDKLDKRVGLSYNEVFTLNLSGALNIPLLKEALSILANRHEALRSHFCAEQGKLLQIIEPMATYTLPFEIENNGMMLGIELAKARIEALQQIELDLEAGPLFKIYLFPVTNLQSLLVFIGHHIILDGWSANVLLQDLAAIFKCLYCGHGPAFPKLSFQYADYSVWQRQILSEDRLQKELAWWKDTLSGMPDAIQLPFDRPRSKETDYRGHSVSISISTSKLLSLKAVALKYETTLFIVLETAFAVLLSRLGAGEDVVIGTAVANRPRLEFEDVCGFFANTIALRNNVDLERRFGEQLLVTRKMVLDSFSHAAPFEAVVNQVVPTRATHHAPVVQVVLTLQNTPGPEQELRFGEVVAKPFEDTDKSFENFELFLNMKEVDGELKGYLSYQTHLFDEGTVGRMAAMFVSLLEAAAIRPDTRIFDLPLLSYFESRKVVEAFNTSSIGCNNLKPVQSLFDLQVQAIPEAVAILAGDKSLTYSGLDAAANRLARYLITQGVGPESVVGVLLERSAELLVALLAIFKAGGAYLPLDTSAPAERLSFMLHDATACMVLTSRRLEPHIHHCNSNAAIFFLDDADMTAAVSMHSSKPIKYGDVLADSTPLSLAYVIYTSGSTGTPKGVMVGHRELAYRLDWMQDICPIGPGDTVLQKTPYSFDVSVWELFWWCSHGARLALMPPGEHRDPQCVALSMEIYHITVVHFVPSLFEHYLDFIKRRETTEGLFKLRAVFASGEPLSPSLALRFNRLVNTIRCGCVLYNLYGPTEATIDATQYRTRDHETSIPIGKPVPHTQVYVVDKHLNPVPIGIAGELLIGGQQISRGYAQRPQLTAERFIANFFLAEPGSRLYRTGDIASWVPDGTLNYLGRQDRQIKIRGMRVELGEIEECLRAQEGIAQVAVTVCCRKTDASPDPQLVAYVVRDGNTAPDPGIADKSGVETWRALYEFTYNSHAFDEETRLDYVGWNSSFTGQPYPLEAMREWRANTLKRLRELPHRRVLEIGCGTGLILSGLASDAERYIATDISANALASCRKLTEGNAVLGHVELLQIRADEVAQFPAASFDLIILNSVIQYFPNENYLTKVMQSLLGLLDEQGVIFAGDLRDLRLLECFHAQMAIAGEKKAHPQEIRSRLVSSMSSEKELLLDPAWFLAFACRNDSIKATGIRPRADQCQTEMALFRYDAVLSKSDTNWLSDTEVTWLDLNTYEAEYQPSLESVLRANPREILGVRKVLDPRLETALHVWRGTSLSSRPEYQTDRKNADISALSLKQLSRLANQNQRSILLVSSTLTGHIDVVIGREREELTGWLANTDVPTGLQSLTNSPQGNLLPSELVRNIRVDLVKRLPGHMIPSRYICLSRLPLTPSGKIDHKALPDAQFSAGQAILQPPQTETERQIASVLFETIQIRSIGRDEDFFSAGMNSLTSIHFLSRLQEEYGSVISARDIFDAPSISQLGARIDAGKTCYSPLIPFAKQDLPLTIICFPPLSGLSFAYGQMEIVEELKNIGNIYGVQCRGYEADQLPFTTYEEMVECFVEHITREIDGPIVCLGWSMGGMIAYDATIRFLKRKKEVNGLIIIDTPILSDAYKHKLHGFLGNGQLPYTDAEIDEVLQKTNDNPIRNVMSQISRNNISAKKGFHINENILQKNIKNNTKIILKRRPIFEKITTKTLLVKACDTRYLFTENYYGWREYIKNIDVNNIDCSHYDIFSDKNYLQLIVLIKKWMKKTTYKNGNTSQVTAIIS